MRVNVLADEVVMQAPTSNLPAMRPRLVRSVGTVRGAVGATAGAVGFVALAVFGKVPVVGAVFAVVFLLMSWRFWLAGIRVEPDGVRVVSLLGVSRQFSWESIDHFSVGPLAGYRYVAHVVLHDGSDFGCLGISAATRPNGERHRLEVQGPVDDLNAALVAWRASVAAVESNQV